MLNDSVTKPTIQNSTVELSSVMNLYLTEWIHRDEIMWKQTFRFYIATLFVMVLPYSTALRPGFLDGVSLVLCPIVGFFMIAVFLYISLAYGYRLKAIGDTYQGLISRIDDPVCKRKHMEDIVGSMSFNVFQPSLAISIPILLTISLLVVDVLLFLIILL